MINTKPTINRTAAYSNSGPLPVSSGGGSCCIANSGSHINAGKGVVVGCVIDAGGHVNADGGAVVVVATSSS